MSFQSLHTGIKDNMLKASRITDLPRSILVNPQGQRTRRGRHRSIRVSAVALSEPVAPGVQSLVAKVVRLSFRRSFTCLFGPSSGL